MGRVDEFLDEVALAPAYTLDALNDTFSVWLTEGYNGRAHEALDGRTPAAAFAADPHPVRPVDQQALREAFRREETRKVDKTGCVKFHGALCEIGARYAGKRITLTYAVLPCGPTEVTAHDGDRLIGPVRPLEWNRPFDATASATDDLFADPPPTPPTRSRYLDALKAKGTKTRQAAGGIHFRQLGAHPEEAGDV